jgi:Domain of unknown function (DUF3560)
MKKITSPDQLSLLLLTPTPLDPAAQSISIDDQITLDSKIAEVLATRRNRFQERRERRLENANNRADSNRRLASSFRTRSNQMSRCIPFGQPILIGHHSEGRDRRFRQRMRDTMNKSIEAGNKAQYYDDKVTAIENNTAIFADDPDAIAKLKARIDELTRQQEFWKSGNKIAKSKKLSDEQKVEQLKSAGHPTEILIPTYGRVGYADYELSNNNANLRRLKTRLEQLTRTLVVAAELGNTEQEYPELKLVIKQSRTINRIQLVFDGKPNEAIRQLLKAQGFRWTPSEGAWQRQMPESSHLESYIVEKISQLPV